MLPPLLVLEPWPLPPLAPQTRPSGTQTEPQCEPPTSVGIILPETGQFLLLCSLQLWQQLQCCRQTYAKVPLFFIHFTSFLWKHLAANDMFWEANSYKWVLALRYSRQYSIGIFLEWRCWARCCKGGPEVFSSWSLALCLHRCCRGHWVLTLVGWGMQHGQIEMCDHGIGCHQWLRNQICGSSLH